MTAHDDDRVLAALRGAVPDVPEVPDRVTSIRHRAGRQRAQIWTQTIGAAASVLVLLGLTAAVAGGGSGSPVRPVSDPLARLDEKLAAQRSVAFEFWSEPAGPVSLPEGSDEEAVDVFTGHATGAVAVDGNGRIDGDLGLVTGMFFGDRSAETHLRLVDGDLYRNATITDHAPAGKKWVLDPGSGETLEPAEIAQAVRMVTAFASDVRYVGGATVRGTAVAEYRLSVPRRFTGGEQVTVTFALDADGLPRRVSARLPMGRLFYDPDTEPTTGGGQGTPPPLNLVDVRLELFGYGDDVSVSPPPAAEVISEEDLAPLRSKAFHEIFERYEACLARAGDSQTARDACERTAEQESGIPGAWHRFDDEEDGCSTVPDENGGMVTSCSDSATVGGAGSGVMVPIQPVPLDGTATAVATPAPPPDGPPAPSARPSP